MDMIDFTDSDKKQMTIKGIVPEKVNAQIDIFKKGIPYINIVKPATVGDGIIQLDENEILHKIRIYNKEVENHKVVKFVPASGAASRMFKSLFEFLASENSAQLLADQSFQSVSYFFGNLQNFAFYDDLKSSLALSDINPVERLSGQDHKLILETLLFENGLNYGNKPKGLLKFHRYGKESKTSTQEHIMEGALYAASNDELFLHFTVSPEHLEDFREHVRKSIPSVEKLFEISCYAGFSVQKPSTDTIAVDINNKVFRDTDGSLLFRPGGHGALIENLNDLDTDLVFVKNIDNVVPDRLKEDTVKYKKALAGLLFEYQMKIFAYTKELLSSKDIQASKISEIEDFVFTKLYIQPGEGYKDLSQKGKSDFLMDKLNRPIRVCGMVKNQGEPGGGPFWAVNPDGTCSLQIIESSQINLEHSETKEIFNKSTHFNPVDLVCGITDFKGNKFDLLKFVDPETGFISEKSKDGKILKALELPGLWNGAMSDWITIFVEVPLITFNPVKTVNDLLRPEHQA
jgi:hypothetical protein